MGAAPTCPRTPACCTPVPRVSSSSLQVTGLLLMLLLRSGWKLLVSDCGIAACGHQQTANAHDGIGTCPQPPGSATCSLVLITVQPFPLV